MRRAVLIGLVCLPACSGLIDGSEERDELVIVDTASLAETVAHETILATRPQGTQLMVEHVNLTLAQNGIVGDVVRPTEIEDRVVHSMTDGTPDVSCPYVSQVEPATTISCRFLVDQALADAMVESPELTQQVDQSIDSTHSDELNLEERDFVKGWAEQAVFSGIDAGAAHSVAVLRGMGLCDQTLDVPDSAFRLGEQQGEALLEQAEKDVMPTIPVTQCNTDLIAQTVYAAAQDLSDEFVDSNPICDGYTPSDLAGEVDLAQAEAMRVEGVEEGMREAYEALRVRLVSTWECECCICYARYGGSGPVYCFNQDDIAGREPSWGGEAAQLAETVATIPQDQCSSTPVPLGSPLVVDIGGDGISLGSERVSFDLAATGEQALLPALEGSAAMLALDLDEDGQIESGAELFGNATSCGESRCVDGTRALAQYDRNGDQIIDTRDPVYARLLLWRDENRNGVSDASELTALSDSGIVEIDLRASVGAVAIDGAGTALRALSYRSADGRTGQIPDVWFHLAFDQMPRNPRTSGIVSTLVP